MDIDEDGTTRTGYLVSWTLAMLVTKWTSVMMAKRVELKAVVTTTLQILS